MGNFNGFKDKDDILLFALKNCCCNTRGRLEGLDNSELDEYWDDLSGRTIDDLCMEYDFLYNCLMK